MLKRYECHLLRPKLQRLRSIFDCGSDGHHSGRGTAECPYRLEQALPSSQGSWQRLLRRLGQLGELSLGGRHRLPKADFLAAEMFPDAQGAEQYFRIRPATSDSRHKCKFGAVLSSTYAMVDVPAWSRRRRPLGNGQGQEPLRITTDKLRSYPATMRRIPSQVAHTTERHANNRAEASRQPNRQRQRHMRRCETAGQAQRFPSLHAVAQDLFRIGRHLLRSMNNRLLRSRSFAVWQTVTAARAEPTTTDHHNPRATPARPS